MPARHEEYITFGRWTLQAASVIYNISPLKVKREESFLLIPPMKMEQTVSRNVSIQNSNARESPKRKNTTGI
jgi:hypothetical protein